MTCTWECHDWTGMFQGTDIEMYCPHVITDQILIACKKKKGKTHPEKSSHEPLPWFQSFCLFSRHWESENTLTDSAAIPFPLIPSPWQQVETPLQAESWRKLELYLPEVCLLQKWQTAMSPSVYHQWGPSSLKGTTIVLTPTCTDTPAMRSEVFPVTWPSMQLAHPEYIWIFFDTIYCVKTYSLEGKGSVVQTISLSIDTACSMKTKRSFC